MTTSLYVLLNTIRYLCLNYMTSLRMQSQLSDKCLREHCRMVCSEILHGFVRVICSILFTTKSDFVTFPLCKWHTEEK